MSAILLPVLCSVVASRSRLNPFKNLQILFRSILESIEELEMRFIKIAGKKFFSGCPHETL